MRNPSPQGCWIVGHRGTMTYAPENTMSAFKRGQELGADLLECDVHLSKDQKCIVMHDEGVERTTNGHGLIQELTSSMLKKLDAGSWFSKQFKGEKILTLDELLKWIVPQKSKSQLPLGLVIEIKNEPIRYLGIEKKIIDIVLKFKMQDRVILIAFDHGVIKRAKYYHKNIAGGILYSRNLENPIERARQVQADAIFPRRNLLSRELVQKAHQNKLSIGTWTVDEIQEMKQILKYPIDTMTSNMPERIIRLLKGN